MNTPVMFAMFTFAALAVAGVSDPTARKGAPEPRPMEAQGRGIGLATAESGITALATQVLGEWNFDDGLGGPASQGWTIHDPSSQEGVYFHVDDFAGLGGEGYAPLRGAKSLWCGLRPSGCTYATLPGYGNNWRQYFESVPFPTTGDVTVDFLVRYDTEPNYDIVSLEYRSVGGRWWSVFWAEGTGEILASATIPADSLAGTARLRLRVDSDAVYSDEDGNYDSSGAMVVDSLTVRDASGVVDFQDFEAEAVNAQATVDGQWTATVPAVYGLHTALVPGTGVLQEDPLVNNATHLWTFFSGSAYDYDCGGHPEQLVVPYEKMIEGDRVAFKNEIRSPSVSVTQDVYGFPVSGDDLSLEFDVYRNLPIDAVVFYYFRVRSLVAGCWGDWEDAGFVYYGSQNDWFRFTTDLDMLLDVGATHVRVAIGAVDMCPFWCDIYGSGDCHTQAPLIDNVRIVSTAPSFIVTNTNDAGAGSLRSAIDSANSSPNRSYITFEIPGAGPHTITPLASLPNVTAPVTIDGYTQPGATPNTNNLFSGTNASLRIVLDGSALASGSGIIMSADSCLVRGLVINDFPGYALVAAGGDRSRIEGCFLGTDVTGTFPEPNQRGIVMDNSSFSVVGGSAPACQNVISGNLNEGIWASLCPGTIIQGNLIGVDAPGTTALGNAGAGIRLLSSTNAIAVSNVISANLQSGVVIGVSPTGGGGCRLESNRIGTDASGEVPRGNGAHGVELTGVLAGATPIVVGGVASTGNLIANNGGNGVLAAMTGVRASISYNDILSNYRGVGVTTGVAGIVFNNIANNQLLGIDLALDGVTPNDMFDVDSGPNSLQNYPTLNAATPLNGGIRLSGSLSSAPSTVYTVALFRSPECDPSGNGEGDFSMGFTPVVTDALGVGTFVVDGLPNMPGGTVFTATASATSLTGTSEFSACLEYLNTLAGANVTAIPVDAATGASPVTLTFDNVTAPGNALLAISNAGPPPPGGFTFGDNATYYDIAATATFTGSVEVCFQYVEGSITGSESELVLLHYDDTLVPPSWVDVTTNVDTVSNLVCGVTTSLSPFVIAEPVGPTDIGDAPGIPTEFALYPCAPNPFNPVTTIRFDVPAGASRVTIAVFDVTGRRVRTLFDRVPSAGQRSVTWDGRDDRGQSVASGVYFYRMSAGVFAQTRKMVLLK